MATAINNANQIVGGNYDLTSGDPGRAFRWAAATGMTIISPLAGFVRSNATAINARLPLGPVTLSKLDPHLKRLQILPSVLESYAEYPGSDCRNGGIVRVRDGYALMDRLYSHHQIFTTGDRSVDLKIAAKAYGLETEVI